VVDAPREAGMKLHRQMLGDAHVDQASAAIKSCTRAGQGFIIRFGRGGRGTRPRSGHRLCHLLDAGTIMALGRREEFRMHRRAALTDGLGLDDVKDPFLQRSIHCGFPVANTASRLLADAIAALQATATTISGFEA